MNNNKQLYNIKKIASMKKEAIVAGVGSFLSNQTNDPDRTALNLGKAVGVEAGGQLGGLAGIASYEPTHKYIDNEINLLREGLKKKRLFYHNTTKSDILNAIKKQRELQQELKKVIEQEKNLNRRLGNTIIRPQLKYDRSWYLSPGSRADYFRSIKKDINDALLGSKADLRWGIERREDLFKKLNIKREATNKAIKRLMKFKKLTPLLPILGYLGGGYLTHKGLNTATKKEPSILDKIKGSI